MCIARVLRTPSYSILSVFKPFLKWSYVKQKSLQNRGFKRSEGTFFDAAKQKESSTQLRMVEPFVAVDVYCKCITK